MIKKINYKPNRCLYIDLKVGETFRYGEDEVGEIIYFKNLEIQILDADEIKIEWAKVSLAKEDESEDK